MKRVIDHRAVLVLAAGLLVGIISRTEGGDIPFYQLPERSTEGGRLFMEKGCIECHSINGLGGTGGPDLGKVRAVWSFLDIAGVMWNHLPKMQSEFEEKRLNRPELKSEEMFQIVAFVYFLSYFGSPGDPEEGELTFFKKDCIKCHSVGSQGSRAARPLDRFQFYRSPAFISAALWNSSKRMTDAMRQRNIPRPTYEAQDIANILAYIRKEGNASEGLPYYLPLGSAQRGGQMFRQKGCVTCHAVRGQGGQVGPALGTWDSGGVLSKMAGAIWNHGPEMWSAMADVQMEYPEFSAEEMSDLMTYLYFSSFIDDSGDASEGKKLFNEKGCALCHGDGASNEEQIAPDPAELHLSSAPEVIAALWNHAAEMKEATVLVDVAWPRFKPGEMADLVKYIVSEDVGRSKPE